MKINWRIWLCYLPLLSLFTLVGARGKVFAQIIPDATLGSEKSVVTPLNSQGDEGHRIDGGAIRGINLFHSFREFNIGEGNSAYFSNPTVIKSIFTRVTGNNPSKLFGKLGVLGDANLYFFNPNGIIFGRNASLDIRGSFVASTTSSLIFPDNQRFSATNPQAPPLLINNVPIPVGLELEGISGTITNAANLEVGKDLKLTAGNLDLENQLHAKRDLTLQATDTVKIRDSKDNPFIASAGGKLFVEGDRQVDIFALNNSNSGLFSGGDMVLRSKNRVGGDAHFTAAGNFRIEKLDGSLGDLYSPYDPVIRANGDVSLDSYTGASLHIFAGGLVFIPGTVSILSADDTANSISETVTLSDGETIEIDGSKEPTLDIRAGTTAFGESFFNTGTPTSADIVIGNIEVFDDINGTAGKVFLTNQYQPNTALDTLFGGITVGSIDTRDIFGGGSVTIDSRSQINLDGVVNVSTFPINNDLFGNGGNVKLLAGGDIDINSEILANGLLGGNVNITSSKNILLNGAEISVLGGGDGNIAINGDNLEILGGSRIRAGIDEGYTIPDAQSGDININATGAINITDESNISNILFPNAVGNTGDININTGSLKVTNGAGIGTATFGEGNSGKLNINAKDMVEFSGESGNGLVTSGAISSVQAGAVGNVGGIKITTGSLKVSNGALLDTRTFGEGNTGGISIFASDMVEFDGESSNGIFTAAYSGVPSDAVGNTGGININTGSLKVSNNAILDNSIFGKGSPQGINIIAKNMVEFDGGFAFSTLQEQAEGSIGNIKITTNSLSLDNGAQLDTSSSSKSDAANIIIDAKDSISFNNESAVFSNIGQQGKGNGGNIEINTNSLSLTNNSQLLTNSFGEGNAGNIIINATDTVSFDGFLSAAFSTVQEQAQGNAGNIEINTNFLSLTNSAGLINSNLDTGNTGKIIINAKENVDFNNSNIFSLVNSEGVGNSQGIEINTKSLLVANGTNLSSSNFGKEGDTGKLIINATEKVEFNNSNVSSTVGLSGEGNSQGIEINTKSLLIDNAANLSTNSFGNGNTGKLVINATETVELNNDSNISSTVGLSGEGNSQGIEINTKSLLLNNVAEISTSSFGKGDAGKLNINATEKVELNNDSIVSSQIGFKAVGNSQGIKIDTKSLLIKNSAEILASTRGKGNAGDINIIATDSVKFDGSLSQALTEVGLNAVGKGGNININTNVIELSNSAKLSTQTSGKGNSGNVNINATEVVKLGNFSEFFTPETSVSTEVSSFGEGKGGDINITTKKLELLNAAELTTRTNGKGNSGDVNINATETVRLTNSSEFLNPRNSIDTGVFFFGEGNGGDINITTGSLEVISTSNLNVSSQLSTTSEGMGNAGNVNITATDKVSFEGRSLITTSLDTGIGLGEGKGGDINITTKILEVNNRAGFTASTTGKGNGGDININATDSISLDASSYISTNSIARGLDIKGNAGNINIETESLQITNQSQLNAFTGGNGNAGDIDIIATDSVILDGSLSDISTFTSITAQGEAGNISIDTGKLNISNLATLGASTNTSGNSGKIEVKATESIILDDRGEINSEVGVNADANSQGIILQTPKLSLTNNSEITAAIRGKGSAGNILIKDADSVTLDNSTISTAVEAGAITNKPSNIDIETKLLSLTNSSQITASTSGLGRAGNITIKADILEAKEGSQITTSTSTRVDDKNIADIGKITKAGNIELIVKDDITLTGENTGIFANTTENSTGNGGQIIIDPILFTVKDGAAIAVNSQGQGVGGDIELAAGTLNLDNGFINARTRSNTGGNITLDIDKLVFLRNGSQISTTAGDEQFGGNGGNILINTPFIVAFPTDADGNDITANAFTGNGGKVNINGQFLFGIESRKQLTPINDITASSTFGRRGEVNINTPGIDPTRNLNDLPQGRINPEVSQNCQASSSGAKTELYDIGTGGIPYNPDALSNAEPFANEDLIPLQPARKSSLFTYSGKTQPENRNFSSENSFTTPSSIVLTEILPCQSAVKKSSPHSSLELTH